jgi:hypothetical protein
MPAPDLEALQTLNQSLPWTSVDTQCIEEQASHASFDVPVCSSRCSKHVLSGRPCHKLLAAISKRSRQPRNADTLTAAFRW